MDIVALKRAVAINGISGLCITKLDILDGMETLKICIAYEYHGKRSEYAPLDAQGWENARRCTWSSRAGRKAPRHHRVGQAAADARAYLRAVLRDPFA